MKTMVTNPMHTCAMIMLFKQHLDMFHLPGGGNILAMDKCSSVSEDSQSSRSW